LAGAFLPMRTALLTALVALVALSGCTDDSPAQEAGETPGPAAATGGDAGDGMAGEESGERVERPLHLEGRTPVGACYGASGVIGNCQNMMGQDNFALLGAGEALSLKGTLTWDDTTQVGAVFAMLLLCDAEGMSCSNDGSQPSATGESPLAFDWDLSPYEGENPALWIIQYTGQGTSGAWALAEAPVDFVFEGVLTSAAP
jgi:hypothetical protein